MADGTETNSRTEKKEKKDRKRKRSEVDGAEAADTTDLTVADGTPAKKEKKDKKDKKDKKRKSTDAVSLAAEDQAQTSAVKDEADAPTTAVEVKEEDDADAPSDKKKTKTKDGTVKLEIPLAALVPFANPLADDKAQKKVLKSVKKAAKNKALKRGVKEVVKCIRKSPPANPSTLTAPPPGIVILAADISPMDVISHIPVLCEDHNIPYVYVPSRAELGAAGATKRPTSVVMVMPRQGKGVKKEEGEGEKEWDEAFAELNKVAVKLGQHVKV